MWQAAALLAQRRTSMRSHRPAAGPAGRWRPAAAGLQSACERLKKFGGDNTLSGASLLTARHHRPSRPQHALIVCRLGISGTSPAAADAMVRRERRDGAARAGRSPRPIESAMDGVPSERLLGTYEIVFHKMTSDVRRHKSSHGHQQECVGQERTHLPTPLRRPTPTSGSSSGPPPDVGQLSEGAKPGDIDGSLSLPTHRGPWGGWEWRVGVPQPTHPPAWKRSHHICPLVQVGPVRREKLPPLGVKVIRKLRGSARCRCDTALHHPPEDA